MTTPAPLAATTPQPHYRVTTAKYFILPIAFAPIKEHIEHISESFFADILLFRGCRSLFIFICLFWYTFYYCYFFLLPWSAEIRSWLKRAYMSPLKRAAAYWFLYATLRAWKITWGRTPQRTVASTAWCTRRAIRRWWGAPIMLMRCWMPTCALHMRLKMMIWFSFRHATAMRNMREGQLTLSQFCRYAQRVRLPLLYFGRQQRITLLCHDTLLAWFSRHFPVRRRAELRADGRGKFWCWDAFINFSSELASR